MIQLLDFEAEITSSENLNDLVEALSPDVLVVHHVALDNGYEAILELSDDPSDANSGIDIFYQLISNLPVHLQQVWKGLNSRRFSIHQRLINPAQQSNSIPLHLKSLQQLVELDAEVSVFITIHPTDFPNLIGHQ